MPIEKWYLMSGDSSSENPDLTCVCLQADGEALKHLVDGYGQGDENGTDRGPSSPDFVQITTTGTPEGSEVISGNRRDYPQVTTLL